MKILKALLMFSIFFWIYTFITSPIYPDPAEIVFLNSTHIHFTLLSLKILKAGIFLSTAFLFQRWVNEKYGHLFSMIGLLIYFVLPWSLYFTAYSYRALFALLVVNVCLLLSIKPQFKKRMFFVLLFIFVILFSKTYLIDQFKSQDTIITQIRPASVRQEITEEVNTQFLSVKQQYLTPRLLRKYIFNYPAIVYTKLSQKAISYFDFEQLLTPLDSYSITSQSGLLPKGNWFTFYIYLIPILIFGVSKIVKMKSFLFIFLFSYLYYIFASKREFLLNQTFLYPFICLAVVFGISFALREKRSVYLKAIFTICLLLTITQYLNVFNTFKYRQRDIRYTHGYAYFTISEFVKNYSAEFSIVHITDRLGPSRQAMDFYLPRTLSTEIEYSVFNRDTIDKQKLYIGLSGEFERTTEKNIKVQDEIVVLDKVKLWDAPVTDYGEQIWVGYIN